MNRKGAGDFTVLLSSFAYPHYLPTKILLQIQGFTAFLELCESYYPNQFPERGKLIIA